MYINKYGFHVTNCMFKLKILQSESILIAEIAIDLNH